MSYHDQFEDADVLSTLSWIDMPDPHRIMKLAALFLEREDEIKSEHRNWEGPTLCNVKPFVKSYYVPPRGKGKSTIEMVLRAIKYQRSVAHQRAQNKPFIYASAKRRSTDNGRQQRRNSIAALNYTMRYKDYNGKQTVESHRCHGMGTVAGILMMVDAGGGYGRQAAYPRVYMRQKATGKVKVVVLSPGASIGSVASALMRLAPAESMRSMFGGDVMTLLFDEEGFSWRGKVVAWENVHKVYDGKAKAHKTRNRPKKD